MVNKINNNDYHDYSKLKMPNAADKSENGEKFSLNYQRAQEEKEDKDKKDKEGESGAAGKIPPRTVVQGGVRLELSRNNQLSSDMRASGKDGTQASGQSLIDTVRSWLQTFAQSLKDFFYRIWNDEKVQADAVNVEETAFDKADGAIDGDGTEPDLKEPERLTEEYLALNNPESMENPEDAAKQQIQRETDRNKEIQKYLRSGNLDQVISLVTENGRKTMAKNSTLLTYYDRTGRIAPLSASDQERILHGDKNVRKL